MAGVFVSHRSSDGGWAVLLDRELSRRFGAEHVFRASRSIRPGQDFQDRILDGVRKSWLVLVIIGAGWSAATDAAGRRRLDDKQDWVRREIAEAFRAGIPVIPVLIDDAPPPVVADLPGDIARLARCQYIRLHHGNDAYDLNRLITELVQLAPPHLKTSVSRTPPLPPRPPRAAPSPLPARDHRRRLPLPSVRLARRAG